MSYKLPILFFLMLPYFLFSQEEKKEIKIELSGSYSYRGINVLLGGSIAKNKNEFSLGARTSATYFSRYSTANFTGIYLEYNRFFSNDKKLSPFILVHYGNLFRTLNSPIDSRKALFQIHELYVGYGLSYKIRNIYIVNSINYGGYMERQQNFYKNESSTFFHVGPMVKLSLKYEL